MHYYNSRASRVRQIAFYINYIIHIMYLYTNIINGLIDWSMISV